MNSILAAIACFLVSAALSSAGLVVSDGNLVIAGSAQLVCQGQFTVAGSAVVSMAPNSEITCDAPIVIDGGGKLEGSGTVDADIENNGEVAANGGSGTTLSLLGTTNNTGLMRANNQTGFSNPGTILNGDGTLVLIHTPSAPPANFDGRGEVITASSLPQLALRIGSSGDRRPSLDLRTYPGHNFVLERSFTLAAADGWDLVSSLENNSNTTLTIEDADVSANSDDKAFYRYRVIDAEAP